MIDAWQSGRFGTHPNLPGWSGTAWSLLLVPGWRDLIGRPLEEVVARQWATTTEVLLDDLQALPPSRLVRIHYDALVAEPQAQMQQLCERVDLRWDRSPDELHLSRHTLTLPDPEKWSQHEAALARVLPSVEATRLRAERFLRQ